MTDNIPNISHQQFAIDAIFLGESTIDEAQKFKNSIQLYTKASGQKVNVEKLEIIFINTKPELEDHICNIMGY